MKITRSDTWKIFHNNWCIFCGKVTEMKSVKTMITDAASKQCKDCGSVWRVIYLDSEDDIFEVDDKYILPDNVKPVN